MADAAFSNENAAGVHPAIWEALRNADDGSCLPYGDDRWTRRAEDRVCEAFNAPNARVFFTCTGTGANMVALDTVLLKAEPVVCAASAHINVNEAGAPERFVGTKLYAQASADGKLTAPPIERVMSWAGFPPIEPPRAVYISQATELGTVYTIAELTGLFDACRQYGLAIHMDGARLANAAARLSTSLAALTTALGVDVVSFGGTKNGTLFGDAVIVFAPEAQRSVPWSQKQAGQLAPKMRFIAAQFEALLKDDLWLRNAMHANAQAQALAAGLSQVEDCELVYPVEANIVFVQLAPKAFERVGNEFISLMPDHDTRVLRLVTSWNTTDAEVKAVLSAARGDR